MATVRRIIYELPERFIPEKAEGWDSLIHLDLTGSDGGQYSIEIENGNVSITDGLNGTPKCVIRTSTKTYLDIELGRQTPHEAMSEGKIEISKVGEALQIARSFRRYNRLIETA